MKFYLGILTLLLLASSCRDRSKEVFTFANETDFNINAGLDNLFTHIFVIENLTSILEAAAQQNGYNLDDLSKVSASTAEIRGKFEDVNYSNVDRVAVNLVDPTGELPKREIFYQEIININHTGPLQLFGSLSDVKELLTKPTYNLEVELRFRSPTTQTLENRFIYNFVAFDNE